MNDPPATEVHDGVEADMFIGPDRPALSPVKPEAKLPASVEGLILARIVGTVCEIGLPDAIGIDDSVAVGDLADKLGCHQNTLYRLVRTLAAQGIFSIGAAGAVRHTPISLLLRRDSTLSQHWFMRFWTLPSIWAAWGDLTHIATTGEPSFPYANGCGFFEHLDRNPAEHQVFSSLMEGGFAGRHEAVASALSFAEGETVVDVGGGSGALLRALLNSHASMRGVLYDLPSVVAGASVVLDSPELQARCRVEAGSFLESVPRGGTTYLLSWILHDWPDTAAITILRATRAAMAPEARLVIIDQLLDDDPARCDSGALINDLNMLVLFGGCERTEAQFNALMTEAGFAVITPTSTVAGVSLLETRPIQHSG